MGEPTISHQRNREQANGIIKAGLGMVTIITMLRGTNNMMGQGYLRQGTTRVKETDSGSQSL